MPEHACTGDPRNPSMPGAAGRGMGAALRSSAPYCAVPHFSLVPTLAPVPAPRVAIALSLSLALSPSPTSLLQLSYSAPRVP